VPQLSLFIDLQTRSLVRGFNNTIPLSQLLSAYQGDTLSLFQRYMNPTGNAAAPYIDADESTAAIEAAIGVVGGLPTGGTFTLTDPDAPQTTGAIPFNATNAQVQTVVRAGLSTNWSLATVTGPAGGPWIITNGATGARSALVLVGAALTPASQGDVTIQAAGDGSTAAIQYVKLQLSPIAYQDTWTPYPAPSITLGGAGTAWTALINYQPYAGTFTLTVATVGTTAPISFDATPSVVQTALAALAGLSATTVGGSVGNYIITFAASHTLTADASGLTGPLAMVGTLSLATVGIEEDIGESASITRTLEIRLTPAGGDPQTVLQVPITILNDLIPNAPAIPTPTAIYLTEGASDARYTRQANNGSDFSNLVTTLSNLWKSLTTTAGAFLYMAASSTLTVLAPNTTGTQKFLSMTSSVPSWQTVSPVPVPWELKSSDFTAVAGHKYQVDTSGGAITITMPATMAVNDAIEFADAKLTWDTHAITLARNGNKINGATSDYVDALVGDKLSAVAIDTGATYGWSVK